jgi:hypothetical protein
MKFLAPTGIAMMSAYLGLFIVDGRGAIFLLGMLTLTFIRIADRHAKEVV